MGIQTGHPLIGVAFPAIWYNSSLTLITTCNRMARQDFVSLIGQTIFFTNPLGRLNSIKIKSYEAAQQLYNLQQHGWTFIKPMERVDEGCQACEG